MIDDPVFWRNTKQVESGCIEWQRCLTEFGYGRMNKRTGPLAGSWLAHRYAYALRHGKPPSNLYVCHKCDNRLCVNQDHLWLGTASDNSKDAFMKGRMKLRSPKEYPNWSPGKMYGAKNRATKLSQDDIIRVRSMRETGLLQREIAAEFDVSQVAISIALRGKTWASQTA